MRTPEQLKQNRINSYKRLVKKCVPYYYDIVADCKSEEYLKNFAKKIRYGKNHGWGAPFKLDEHVQKYIQPEIDVYLSWIEKNPDREKFYF